MFSYFSYTECESAGPFDKTPGYKIKSATTFDSDLQSELETMNRAIAAFPAYTPPKLDIFTSTEQFLDLDKNWSYSPIGGGSLAFYRLFTSGMARGRPGNPFHQVVTIDYEKFRMIESFLTSKNGNVRFVPADFYFWEDWISPRGDDEVEESQTSNLGMPVPTPSEVDLMEGLEIKLTEQEGRSEIAVFEESYLDGDIAYLPADNDEEFFKTLATITRLFPSSGSWVVPFSNHPGSLSFSNLGGDSKPIYKTDKTYASGSVWTECLALAAENGLMSSVLDATTDLDELLAPGFGSKRNLQHLPLSLLLCGHEIISFEERYVVEEMASYCQMDSSPLRFRSEEAKNKAIANLDGSFSQSLLSDHQADVIYGVVSQIWQDTN